MSPNTPPNRKKVTVLALILLVLGICTILILRDINSKLQTTPVKISQKPSVNIISASYDKPFNIELMSNISTGYQWVAEFDTKILKLNYSDSRQSFSEGKIGIGDIQVFEFQPINDGNTIITFKYLKPWETNNPPLKTKVYEVTIN